MIVTFYSYKGGVGRSMALANVAKWFQIQGLRVVMIDWDLEAPGLESFFSNDEADREALRSKLGVLDLAVAYRDLFPSLPRPTRAPAAFRSEHPQADARPVGLIDVLNEALPPLAHMLVPIKSSGEDAQNSGSLWLLSAGSRGGSRFDRYAETVQQFDWAEFYGRYQGETYFEWMRQQLLRPDVADIVLIDSRTGVAEMSGVCTRQLADVIVILCAPNDQNLDGVEMMARSFTRADLIEARGGRPIELVMVPARVDISEGRPIDLFEQRFKAKLEPFVPVLFRRLKVGFSKLRIPYISAYAYAERLAIGDAEGVSRLQEAYITLAAHVAALAPASSAVKRRCRQALQKTFGLPTVFTVYLDAEGASLGSGVRELMDTAGVITVLPEGKPEAAMEAAVQTRGAGGSSAAVVVIGGSGSMSDERLREMWRRSREEGVCLFLVANASSVAAWGTLPRWARRMRLFEVPRQWDDLVPLLQSPCQVQRVPFTVPRASEQFFDRTEESNRIKELLVRDDNATDPIRPVSLVGFGGVGKSELAKSICRDEDVIEFFEDGILWLTLGAQPDLLALLTGWVAAFGGDTGVVANLEMVERKLSEQLISKRCLLVFDDVTEAVQWRQAPHGGPGCRVLITTRVRDVAIEANAAAIEIGPLQQGSARQVLMAGLDEVSVDEALVSQFVALLGNVPLALKVSNRIIRTRIQLGDSITGAMRDLANRIREEGLAAIDPGTSPDSSTLFSSFMGAIERLDSAERARLPLLASVIPGRPLTLQQLAAATRSTVEQSGQMARRLAAVSLAEFDPAAHTVKFPELVLAFFQSLELRQRRAESTRVVASGPKSKVFISYRREDSAGYAGRLYDRLAAQFGLDRVFMDIDTIGPGEDFREVLERQIAESFVVIAVIGRGWLTSRDNDGRPRLADPHDFVRIEIEAALARNLPVIPVLVDGTLMPSSEDLPPPLASLARRNALEIGDVGFNRGMDLLIQAVERLAGGPGGRVTPALEIVAPAASTPPASAKPVRWNRRVVLAAIGASLAVGLAGSWFGLHRSAPDSKRGADQERAALLFARAEDYYFGRGVAQNYGMAESLYQQSADLGFAPAQNSLGRMYELGQGVSKDLTAAIRWYGAAAQQGHPEAQAALKKLNSKAKTQPVR